MWPWSTPSRSPGERTLHAAHITPLEAALPFLAAIALLVLGSLCAAIAARRILPSYRTAYAHVGAEQRSPELEPAAIENALEFACDGAQIMGMFIAPALALALNHGQVDAGVRAAYFLAFFLAVVIGLCFVSFVGPFTYGDHPLGRVIGGRLRGLPKRGWFTPVVQLGMGVNAAAAVAVYLLSQ